MNIKKLMTTAAVASLFAIGVVSVSAQGPKNGEGPRSENREARQALVEEYTGLEGAELREAIQGGATLAELIEANGSSVDGFVAEAATLAEERLDAAVEAGRLTEEEAAEKLAEITENITDRVNGEFEPGERRGPRGERGPRGNGEASTNDADL